MSLDRNLFVPEAVFLSVFLLTACGQPPAEKVAEAEPVAEAAAELAEHTARGEVTQIPESDDSGSQFMVRHEPIMGMVDQDGNSLNMDTTMNMPFFPADESLIEGLTVGDKITMTITLDWDKVPAMQVTAIDKLPAETELNFTEAEGDHAGHDMDHGGMNH